MSTASTSVSCDKSARMKGSENVPFHRRHAMMWKLAASSRSSGDF